MKISEIVKPNKTWIIKKDQYGNTYRVRNSNLVFEKGLSVLVVNKLFDRDMHWPSVIKFAFLFTTGVIWGVSTHLLLMKLFSQLISWITK